MEICKNAKCFLDYISAGRPDTAAEILSNLANNCDHKIRRRVAENKNTPTDVLRRLSQDTHPEVKIAVATNLRASDEIIYRLCQDDDPSVRFAIAEDLSTDDYYLELLLEDENPYVSSRAQDTLALKQANQQSYIKRTARIFQWTDYTTNPLRFA